MDGLRDAGMDGRMDGGCSTNRVHHPIMQNNTCNNPTNQPPQPELGIVTPTHPSASRGRDRAMREGREGWRWWWWRWCGGGGRGEKEGGKGEEWREMRSNTEWPNTELCASINQQSLDEMQWLINHYYECIASKAKQSENANAKQKASRSITQQPPSTATQLQICYSTQHNNTTHTTAMREVRSWHWTTPQHQSSQKRPWPAFPNQRPAARATTISIQKQCHSRW